ncbi:MAG: cyclic nucleotide-binding domain-containing protein [Bdellovibrionales bacterium]|nr:cyclic nucleotide-binding domain-containing protein [Bdellovibrionales bacterium]
MDRVERVSYPAGQSIFEEGDQEEHFYIVQSGEVEIYTQTKDGSSQFSICTFGPGESFGEFALLDKAPRSASARAKTDVELVRVSAEAYQQLLAGLPEWAGSMLQSFANRLKQMNDRLRDLPQFMPRK